MSEALAVRGEERELALSEVEAVLSAVPEGDYRDRLDAIHSALAVSPGPSDGTSSAVPSLPSAPACTTGCRCATSPRSVVAMRSGGSVMCLP